jgi:uncharacterized protein YqeY
MSLESRIMEDLKAAMKAKDAQRMAALRSIKTAIINAKTAEGASGELDEAAELKLVQKLAKQRQDALDIYKEQNREDLAETEAAELAVLQAYLPKPMEDGELEEALKGIIAQTGAASPSDMGKVMGMATKALAGKADGKRISAMVQQLLQNA